MLLDAATWTDNIFVGGKWVPGSAGVIDVVEPATQKVLGQLGLADADDVGRAAESAAES